MIPDDLSPEEFREYMIDRLFCLQSDVTAIRCEIDRMQEHWAAFDDFSDVEELDFNE